MNVDPEKIALVDMDGTIADYEKAIKTDMAYISSPEDDAFCLYSEHHPKYLKNRMDIIKRQPGWWRNIAPIPAGFFVLSMMRQIGFDTHILTKGPSSKSHAWAEKVDWVRKHIGDIPITITEDKGLVYGRVLFDDYPGYVMRWLKWRPRGIVVMMKNQGNEKFSHDRVIKIDPETFTKDADRVAEVREKLQAAFDR